MPRVRYLFAFARRSISLSSTVLPTPRRPVKSMLFSGFFCLTRPKRIRACSRMGSRPTSSGGGEPAPGEKGFLMGSMRRFIPIYTRLYKVRAIIRYKLSHLEHLHHLIPEVVDDLHCNPPGLRLVERPRGVAVQGRPGFRVDLGLQRRLQ